LELHSPDKRKAKLIKKYIGELIAELDFPGTKEISRIEQEEKIKDTSSL
jgi:hypothetical protein